MSTAARLDGAELGRRTIRSGGLVVHHFGPDPATVGGMASVIRVLTEHRVGGDLVYSHATWTPASRALTARLLTRSATALSTIGPGHIAHVHLSERGSFVREGALIALARRRGLVVLATIHGASFLPFAERHRRLAAAVLRRAHAITCLEEAVLEVVRACAPGVHCEILPNPVSVSHAPIPADETEELVLFAGEIGLRKGADVLHRAWRLLASRRPRARCLMVGPLADYSPPATERLRVSAPVAPQRMRELMIRARVVVLPARAEGMPMALTEAMSVGRPFVSTPVGGIPELAREGGLLVAVGDETALAERLNDLLASPELAREIGERARRFCLQTRSVEVLDSRLGDLYRAAAQSRGAARSRQRA